MQPTPLSIRVHEPSEGRLEYNLSGVGRTLPDIPPSQAVYVVLGRHLAYALSQLHLLSSGPHGADDQSTGLPSSLASSFLHSVRIVLSSVLQERSQFLVVVNICLFVNCTTTYYHLCACQALYKLVHRVLPHLLCRVNPERHPQPSILYVVTDL